MAYIPFVGHMQFFLGSNPVFDDQLMIYQLMTTDISVDDISYPIFSGSNHPLLVGFLSVFLGSPGVKFFIHWERRSPARRVLHPKSVPGVRKPNAIIYDI